MTKIAISPNVNGAGTFTIAAPDSNTDRTLTLPDAGGVVATQEYIPTALNATGSAPIYACRAWVNFSGSGTVAIRASGNVSSITDNGTGDYTINFDTALVDANYAPVYAVSDPEHAIINLNSLTTSSVSMQFGNRGSSIVDPDIVSIAIIR